MTTTVWFRENEDQEWQPAIPEWRDIEEDRAHTIADLYNTRYSHGMWWVCSSKPCKDCIVEQEK